MKKFGEGWSVSVQPGSTFATDWEDKNYNLYWLSIKDSVTYVTKRFTFLISGFDNQVTAQNGRVVFPSAAVSASILAIDKQKNLEIAHVPLAIRSSTRDIAPYWGNIVKGFEDYVAEALVRTSYPERNPFYMHIKHPWFEASITEVVEKLGKVEPHTGHLLVESISSCYVDVNQGKGLWGADTLTLRQLTEPAIRRYIIPPSAFYGGRHPAEDLCFTRYPYGTLAFYFHKRKAPGIRLRSY